jgi:hypothetical protein
MLLWFAARWLEDYVRRQDDLVRYLERRAAFKRAQGELRARLAKLS